MVRILLAGSVLKVKILKDKQVKEVYVDNGVYDKKTYRYLIITDGKVFLDGEDLEVLANKYDGISIEYANPLDILVDHYHNPAIYIEGINAIPEGKEREALNLLLNRFLSSESDVI